MGYSEKQAEVKQKAKLNFAVDKKSEQLKKVGINEKGGHK